MNIAKGVVCAAFGVMVSVRTAGAVTLYAGDGLAVDIGATIGSVYIYNKNQAFGSRQSVYGLPIDKDSSRVEGFIKPTIRFGWDNSAGSLYGAVSSVSAFTIGDTDGVGATRDDPSSSGLDEAYFGWRYPIQSLGDATSIDLSTGRQGFVVGDGFVIGEGHLDQGHDAAFWLAPRIAFDQTTIARVTSGSFGLQAFDLLTNSDIDVISYKENLRLRGGSLSWRANGSTQAEYLYVKSRDGVARARDGMTTQSLRVTGIPLLGVNLSGEYVDQRRSGANKDHAWYAQADYSYLLDTWKVGLSYRHSEFSASYDPLMYGCPDIGKWCSGEIVGSSLLFNSNERVDMYRVDVSPNDILHLGVIYYDIDNYRSIDGASSKDFAKEVNLYCSLMATSHLSLGVTLGFAQPQEGASALLGQDRNSSLLEAFGYYTF